MKTKMFLVCAVAFVMSQVANAQVWAGGSLGFDYSSSDKGEKITNFSLNPVVGFELAEKWDLGLELGYSHSLNKTDSEDVTSYVWRAVNRKTSTNALSVEPFVRYSFLKAGIVTFFVDGTVGYGYAKSKIDYSLSESDFSGILVEKTGYTTETTCNNYLVGFRPGVKIELTSHLELESHLGFVGYTHSEVDASSVNDGSTSAGGKTVTDKFGFTANSTALNLGLIWKF